MGQDRALREYEKVVTGWTIVCLEKPKAGCREGEGRKETTSREYVKAVKDWGLGRSKISETVRKRTMSREIKLTQVPLRSASYPSSAEVEYRVQGIL